MIDQCTKHGMHAMLVPGVCQPAIDLYRCGEAREAREGVLSVWGWDKAQEHVGSVSSVAMENHFGYCQRHFADCDWMCHRQLFKIQGDFAGQSEWKTKEVTTSNGMYWSTGFSK